MVVGESRRREKRYEIRRHDLLVWHAVCALNGTDLSGNFQFQHYYFEGMRVSRREANYWVDHYGLDHLGSARNCGYAHQQVYVFRHNDITQQKKRILGTYFIEDFHRAIACPLRS